MRKRRTGNEPTEQETAEKPIDEAGVDDILGVGGVIPAHLGAAVSDSPEEGERPAHDQEDRDEALLRAFLQVQGPDHDHRDPRPNPQHQHSC